MAHGKRIPPNITVHRTHARTACAGDCERWADQARVHDVLGFTHWHDLAGFLPCTRVGAGYSVWLMLDGFPVGSNVAVAITAYDLGPKVLKADAQTQK